MNRTINDLSHAEMVDMLDAELTTVAAILKGLSDEEWSRTTLRGSRTWPWCLISGFMLPSRTH